MKCQMICAPKNQRSVALIFAKRLCKSLLTRNTGGVGFMACSSKLPRTFVCKLVLTLFLPCSTGRLLKNYLKKSKSAKA